MEYLKFQKGFLKNALAAEVTLSCLSIPRGQGKSTLCGHLIARFLTPSDSLYVGNNFEVVLLAGSLEQSRFVFRQARIELEERSAQDCLFDYSEKESSNEYSFIDSVSRLGIKHKKTNARLRVISSDSKKAFGFVGVRYVIGDEPGTWETIGGQRMFDAIMTSAAKVNSELKAILIGTIAPADETSWWAELIAKGTIKEYGIYVMALQGDRAKWDKWQTIAKVNPVMWRDKDSRKRLLAERDQARSDPAAKTRFLRYRLNIPEREESQSLISVADWQRVLDRKVPETERSDVPVVAVDLGGGRSWSAATAIFENGRVECLAMCPGIPSIAEQERRDRVTAGLYQKLVDSGQLIVAEGCRIPVVADFVAAIVNHWGQPYEVTGDRWREAELMDALAEYDIAFAPRIPQWRQSSEDIRALRKLCLDGNLSIETQSRALLTFSIAHVRVETDKSGNQKLVKKGTNGTGRDDVAVSFCLACGAYERSMNELMPNKSVYLIG